MIRQVLRENMEHSRERDLALSLQYENRFDETDNHRLTADVDFDISREKERSVLQNN